MNKGWMGIKGIIGAILVVAATSQAAVLIEVDISDPSAVTFTATSAFSSLFDDSATNNSGVTLQSFFETAELIAFTAMPGSTLTPSGTTSSFTGFFNNFGSLTQFDLNFFRSAPDGDIQGQVFSTTTPAFSGVAVLNLSFADLPLFGTTGSIFAASSI